MPNDVKAIVSLVTLLVADRLCLLGERQRQAAPVLVRDRLCRVRGARHVGVPRGAGRQAGAARLQQGRVADTRRSDRNGIAAAPRAGPVHGARAGAVTVRVDGQRAFPRGASRRRRCGRALGTLVLWGTIALCARADAGCRSLFAWQHVPLYAAVIGGGAMVLFAPLLLQPFPDSFVNGRRGLVDIRRHLRPAWR